MPDPRPDPNPRAWSNLTRDGEFLPVTVPLGPNVELVIEPCTCAGREPCDFPVCPRRIQVITPSEDRT